MTHLANHIKNIVDQVMTLMLIDAVIDKFLYDLVRDSGRLPNRKHYSHNNTCLTPNLARLTLH
jgi:hypothetical protein